jgi:hypothetical protein
LYLQINNQRQQNQFTTISGMTRGSDSAIFSLGKFLPLMNQQKKIQCNAYERTFAKKRTPKLPDFEFFF